MDIQAIAQQLMSYLGNNPELIAQFVQHPYSTTAEATGSNEKISQKDMSQIVTQVAAQTNNQKLGSKDTASVASALLGQAGGSVHDLTSALFGTPGNMSTAQIAARSAAGGLAAQGLASLITAAMGTNNNAQASNTAASGAAAQMPDLSALAKLAEGFLGK